MPNDLKEKLTKLQNEKEGLILAIKDGVSNETKDNYHQRIKAIKTAMADLNKLDDSEKNIHIIWIGNPPEGEFDNLKLWAKYNPDCKIHIWTDLNHVLADKLNSIILKSSTISDGVRQGHSFKIESNLKDNFYYEYQLKNPTKTFDENVKDFLINNFNADSSMINEWIEWTKDNFIQEQEDIKKYTSNEVIIHDVNQEKDSIFPSKEYYDGYLKTLEHLHLCAGASDRLRYAILDKFGGLYLDTDTSLKFDLTAIKNNQKIMKLIDSIDCHENWNYEKPDLIINEMILKDSLDKLNDQNLKDFSKKWQKITQGDASKNLEQFNKIGQEFKNLNLNLVPNIQISDFPIDNVFQIVFHKQSEERIFNAFILSKTNSKFLQEVMKGIEMTDEKIKDMDMHTKLINKNHMILNHTGPEHISYKIMENDEDHFYQQENNTSKIANFDSLNSYLSSWFSNIRHKDRITKPHELKRLFFSSTKDNLNYDQMKKSLQDLDLQQDQEESYRDF